MAFDEVTEIIFEGTPEMTLPFLRRLARSFGWEGSRVRLETVEVSDVGPAYTLRVVKPGGGGGAIGRFYLNALPNSRCLLTVPPGRDSNEPARHWEHDVTGELFGCWFAFAMENLKRLGFIADRRRFRSAEILSTAVMQLGVADEPGVM
jgi:hypothetical protein